MSLKEGHTHIQRLCTDIEKLLDDLLHTNAASRVRSETDTVLSVMETVAAYVHLISGMSFPVTAHDLWA